MADTYGSSSLSYQTKAAAEAIASSHGGAVEALRVILNGATVTLNGHEFDEIIQALHMIAVVELSDLIGGLVPHMEGQL